MKMFVIRTKKKDEWIRQRAVKEGWYKGFDDAMTAKRCMRWYLETSKNYGNPPSTPYNLDLNVIKQAEEILMSEYGQHGDYD